jgi:hypothetical protein
VRSHSCSDLLSDFQNGQLLLIEVTVECTLDKVVQVVGRDGV